jgi:phage protein D
MNNGYRDSFDTLTPEFHIRINGNALPNEAMADLIAASITEDVDATGMFSFTLLSWNGVEMKVKWVDDDLFAEGNPVEVLMGYRDNLQMLFKGEITGLEPLFDTMEPPTLTVRGHDRRHRLMRKCKTCSFLNMKDSDIASQIAGGAGLTPAVQDTGVTLDYVLQHNQTDLEFLEERARRIGYEVVVVDRTLHFRPRRNKGSEVLTLRREVELLEFHPRLTTLGQVQEMQVRGWNPKAKQEVVARSAVGEETSLMGGSTSGPARVSRAFGDTGSGTVATPVQTQAEADRLAQGWFGEMALHYIAGHGVCIGQPTLRAGSMVKVEGLGKRFSGLYYVTSTEHSYKPSIGYRTAFTVRRNAT